MRLNEWRKSAPAKESMSPAVLAALEPVLRALGAEPNPECWVSWGDDPQYRYSVLAPTRAGLANVSVRVESGGEGPRAAGKLVRWSRLQLSELNVEAQGGHRLIAMQVEGQVLRGVDAEADAIAAFVRGLVAAADGREWRADDSPVPVAPPKPAKAAAAAPNSRAGTSSPRRTRSATASRNAAGTAVPGRRRAGGPASEPSSAGAETRSGDGAPVEMDAPAAIELPAPASLPANTSSPGPQAAGRSDAAEEPELRPLARRALAAANPRRP